MSVCIGTFYVHCTHSLVWSNVTTLSNDRCFRKTCTFQYELNKAAFSVKDIANLFDFWLSFRVTFNVSISHIQSHIKGTLVFAAQKLREAEEGDYQQCQNQKIPSDKQGCIKFVQLLYLVSKNPIYRPERIDVAVCSSSYQRIFEQHRSIINENVKCKPDNFSTH